MSRATEKTKWRTHGSYRTQKRATVKFEKLEKQYPGSAFCVVIRQWDNKDKRRYQVKEIIRKGEKK